MKKKLIIIISLAASIFTNAQSWDSLGPGIGSNCGGFSYFANSLAVYNNNLYIGGAFSKSGINPVNCIAKWDGIKWDSLGDGTGLYCSSNGIITSLVNFNGFLIAGGDFDTINHISANNIAEWNGTLWSPLGNGINSTIFNGISAVCTYNGNLYAGGSFDDAGGNPTNNIAMWNGTSWSALGAGVNSNVMAIYSYNGNLCVGGDFDSAGGIIANGIAVWNGTNWSTLGNGVNGNIYAICSYDGNLYVGGNFDSAGGNPANNIAMWNGTSWSALGGGITGIMNNNNGPVYSLASYNNYLYVGGPFDTAGGMLANGLARWDGTNWSLLPQQLSENNFDPDSYRGAYALLVYANSLYVAGSFDSAGTIPVSDVAVWTSPSSINELSNKYSIKAFPNPNNGLFTIQSNTAPVNSIVEIYNILGQNIYQNKLNTNTLEINLSNQPAGMYLYRVISETGECIGSGKLVIE
ncbi:MAG: T9SS type A sorting domain-containing protein [Bacteroidia bacterium]